MGAKQTKGQEAGGASPQHGWKRTPTKERGDILASLMLKSGDRLSRGGTPPPPYQRRIGMIQEMMLMAKQGKQDEATEMLKTLRQDLGMESTSLDDVLYRYASFRNLVDPITHDLIISLARYVHCPKTEGDSLGAMEKVCRQLTYHLSPHSQWRRQGLLKRKPQAWFKRSSFNSNSSGASGSSSPPRTDPDPALLQSELQQEVESLAPGGSSSSSSSGQEQSFCSLLRWSLLGAHTTLLEAEAILLGLLETLLHLKAVLSAPLSSGALDLSGIPLAARDMERLCAHLQRHASIVVSLELGFSELTDEAFLLLLPTLAALPHLETLALNGNRLTRAVLKEVTDALKDPGSFPSVTWIDLGNNVDIFSLPQPFLVSLRKRCPKQGNLPTILEFGESQASDAPERLRGLGEEEETDDTNRTESLGELRSEVEEELDGEMEIEEMMEELLDFDREVAGREDEDESMWTVEEQRKGGRRRGWRGEEEEEVERAEKEKEAQRKELRPGRRAAMADDGDDTHSRSSHLSCSSQSQHSSGAAEPMRVEDLDEVTGQSDHLT